MLAPPDMKKWLLAGQGVDLSTVDWSKDSTGDDWQKLIDAVKGEDVRRAVAARDAARDGMQQGLDAPFWEKITRLTIPGAAYSLSKEQARGELRAAIGRLPKGPPSSEEWIKGIAQAESVMGIARDGLLKQDLQGDAAQAERVLAHLEAARRYARHALEAPEVIEGHAPTPPPAPVRPPADDDDDWWLWGLGALLLLAGSGDDN